MEEIHINEVIFDVVNMQKVNLRAGVDMQAQCTATEGTFIEADRGWLTQVLTNVIGNAIKFTKEASIRIETRPDASSMGISISDIGPGIPAEVLPNLFGKFVTKSLGIENYQGTGLGLFISKAIVAAHGGRISAHNNEMGGATFEIILHIMQNGKS